MKCLLFLTAQNVMVSIHPRGQSTVKVDSSLSVLCEVQSPIKSCRVEIPGEPNMILQPGEEESGYINYYGEGFAKGHCGVKIGRIAERNNGTFRCFLVPENSRVESTASLDIVIASKFYSF